MMSASLHSGGSSILGSAAQSPISPATKYVPGRAPSMTTRLSLHVPSLFQGGRQSPQSSPRKHERYYFADGNIVFSVDGTLYNIHRYFFQRDSSVFASMLSLPLRRWDDTPIPLTGVTAKDFDLFLSILYPIHFGVFSATTVDEWTSILSLAVKWSFQSIKDLAIKQLSPITSPIDKIVLGRSHNIAEWLPSAYADICRRKDALTLEEGVRLGMEDVIRITAMRQGDNNPNFSTTEQADALKRMFGLPSIATSPYITKTRETVQAKVVDAVVTKSLPKSQQWKDEFGGGSERLHDEEDSDRSKETCRICNRECVGDHLCPFCGLHNCVCPPAEHEDDDGYCKLCGEEGLCRTCPFCGRYDCVCVCGTANRVHNDSIDTQPRAQLQVPVTVYKNQHAV